MVRTSADSPLTVKCTVVNFNTSFVGGRMSAGCSFHAHRIILIMKLLWRLGLIVSVPAWGQPSPTINDLPSREFGHAKLFNPVTSDAPNLLEGRELNTPSAVAFSPSGGAMYVADTSNHRVLAWLNPAGLTKGNQADKVIGQRDFYSNTAKRPRYKFLGGPEISCQRGRGWRRKPVRFRCRQ